MWALLGLAVVIALVLSTGGLAQVKGLLIASLVMAIAAFLVVGVIWERGSGASRMWSRASSTGKKPIAPVPRTMNSGQGLKGHQSEAQPTNEGDKEQ